MIRTDAVRTPQGGLGNSRKKEDGPDRVEAVSVSYAMQIVDARSGLEMLS